MKKRILIIAVATFVLFPICVLCIVTAFHCPTYFNGNFYYPDGYKVVSRVYKNELSTQATTEEIAQLLVKRMMNKQLPGNMCWTRWVWVYKIKEIAISFDDRSGSISIDVWLHVKPLIADEWQDVWTFKVNRVKGGWVSVYYFMIIDDKGEYYELRGPYSGG